MKGLFMSTNASTWRNESYARYIQESFCHTSCKSWPACFYRCWYGKMPIEKRKEKSGCHFEIFILNKIRSRVTKLVLSNRGRCREGVAWRRGDSANVKSDKKFLQMSTVAKLTPKIFSHFLWPPLPVNGAWLESKMLNNLRMTQPVLKLFKR